MPFQIWMSEDPSMILFIDGAYGVPRANWFDTNIYPGLYFSDDGGSIKLIISCDGNDPTLVISEIDTLVKSENGFDLRSGAFMVGRFSVTNDQLRLTFPRSSPWRVAGYRQIIFNRIEDYEPIDPEDWFPSPSQ